MNPSGRFYTSTTVVAAVGGSNPDIRGMTKLYLIFATLPSWPYLFVVWLFEQLSELLAKLYKHIFASTGKQNNLLLVP